MTQDRLNGFVALCIEKKLLGEIDIDLIISGFASRNVEENLKVIRINYLIHILIDNISYIA